MKTEEILKQAVKKIEAKKEELTIEELNFLALNETLIQLYDVNSLLNSLNNKK